MIISFINVDKARALAAGPEGFGDEEAIRAIWGAQ
jgi:hypothetical protein